MLIRVTRDLGTFRVLGRRRRMRGRGSGLGGVFGRYSRVSVVSRGAEEVVGGKDENLTEEREGDLRCG